MSRSTIAAPTWPDAPITSARIAARSALVCARRGPAIDLGEISLEAPVDRTGRERRAIFLGAHGKLVHPPAGFLEAAPGGLGGAAYVLVPRSLGFPPGMLHVGGEEKHPVDLAVEI